MENGFKKQEFIISKLSELCVADPDLLNVVRVKKDAVWERSMIVNWNELPTDLQWRCIIEEKDSELVTGEISKIQIRLFGITKNLASDTQAKMLSMFRKSCMFQKLVNTSGELSCDWPHFIVETDKAKEQFELDSDGFYGTYATYLRNIGYYVEFSLDTTHYSFEDVAYKLKNLFHVLDENNNATTEDSSLSDTIRVREWAASILDKFENILDEHSISIPDESREGAEEEACIYGMTYAKLEDDITNLLCLLIKTIKENPDADIEEYSY
ncbi:MAG: hypothetical protein IKB01_07470 [Lachnospiraceae bacterium]|nr:hypothetical protein [Lachnospiraceae bacterium]